jgi:hypothetical protein
MEVTEESSKKRFDRFGKEINEKVIPCPEQKVLLSCISILTFVRANQTELLR